MPKYPLKVTYSFKPLKEMELEVERGIDVEADFFTNLTAEFLKLDPSLSDKYVRGAIGRHMHVLKERGPLPDETVFVLHEDHQALSTIPEDYIRGYFWATVAAANKL